MADWKYTRLSGTNILVQWSTDKQTWTTEASDDSIWMRTSINGGSSWKVSRVVGEAGDSAILTALGMEAFSVPCDYYKKTKEATDITIPFRAIVGNKRLTCTISGTMPNGVTVKTNTPATSEADGSLVLTLTKGDIIGGENSDLTVSIVFTITVTESGYSASHTHVLSLTKNAENDSLVKVLWLYQRNDDGTTAPSTTGVTDDPTTWGNWGSTIIAPTSSARYIWAIKADVLVSNNSSNPPTFTTPVIIANYGEKGASAKTIGIKSGYSAFSTATAGHCYAHGYDISGAAQDQNGYIECEGLLYYVAKCDICPNYAVDGCLIVNKNTSYSSALNCYAAFYDFTDGNWYYYTTSTTPVKITTPSDYIAFATYVSKTSTSAININMITPSFLNKLSTDVNFHYDGIALLVTDGNASFDSLSVVKGSDNKFNFTAGSSITASYGSIVFLKGSTSSTPSANDLKTIYVFNGSKWSSAVSKSYFSNCVNKCAGDLPGIAGVYNDQIGASAIPSVCGTYIETLTANSAFINKLFANAISINNGGYIQSNGYSSTAAKGFKVDSDGNANFNSGTFKGVIKATTFEIIENDKEVEIDLQQVHTDAESASASASSASESASSASSSASSASSSASSASSSASAASGSASSASSSASAAKGSADSASASAGSASESANSASESASSASGSASSAEDAKNKLENGDIVAKNATNAVNAETSTNVDGGEIKNMTTGGTNDTDVALRSPGWKSGDTTGFGILKNGNAEFNNVKIRGTITDVVTGGDSDTDIAFHSSDWTSAESTTGFGILKNGDAYFNNGTFSGLMGRRVLIAGTNYTSIEDVMNAYNAGTLESTSITDLKIADISSKFGFSNEINPTYKLIALSVSVGGVGCDPLATFQARLNVYTSSLIAYSGYVVNGFCNSDDITFKSYEESTGRYSYEFGTKITYSNTDKNKTVFAIYAIATRDFSFENK